MCLITLAADGIQPGVAAGRSPPRSPSRASMQGGDANTIQGCEGDIQSPEEVRGVLDYVNT